MTSHIEGPGSAVADAERAAADNFGAELLQAREEEAAAVQRQLDIQSKKALHASAVLAERERRAGLGQRVVSLEGRLDRLRRRDIPTERAAAVQIVERLLESRAIEDPARLVELQIAVANLSRLRELEVLLPSVTAKAERDLIAVRNELKESAK
jgi:hypothetical protein